MSQNEKKNIGIAGIAKRWISGIFDEIEKGFEMDVLEALGGLFLAFRALNQKRQKLIRCDGVKHLIIEPGIEFVQKQPIILDRILLPSSFSDNP